MSYKGSFSNVVLRRLASMTIVILVATMASSFVLSRSASTPQVSAAQMAELTGALTSAPGGAVEDSVLRTVTQEGIIDIPGDGTPAAFDYYLEIEGIEGESSSPDGDGAIEILSWSWGETNVTRASGGGGGGAGKVSMQDFHFTMKTSKASPQLFLAVATGKHIPQATFDVFRSDGQPYMKIHLKDVLVTSYQTGGSSGDVVPTDQISLNFTKIEFTVWPLSTEGSVSSPVKAGYDLKLNKKI